jgi:Insertion element 4 transposase N-terminal
LLAQSVMPALPVSVAGVLSGPQLPAPQECLIGLGVLTCEVSTGLVDEVIELASCREKRRRLLPAQTVVYFVPGLCLFSGADSMGPPGYRSVMRWLTNGRRHLHAAAALCALPLMPAEVPGCSPPCSPVGQRMGHTASNIIP